MLLDTDEIHMPTVNTFFLGGGGWQRKGVLWWVGADKRLSHLTMHNFIGIIVLFLCACF